MNNKKKYLICVPLNCAEKMLLSQFSIAYGFSSSECLKYLMYKHLFKYSYKINNNQNVKSKKI
jgi:hypothetical protein